jgi:hypothetical protein
MVFKTLTLAFRSNTALAKVAVQCPADTFVVNQNWFSASTFVVKIATFAKPENVMGKFKKHSGQTREPPKTVNIDSS